MAQHVSDRGQALIEFAMAFPLVMMAILFTFASLDAAATVAALENESVRAATVLAGTNDDEQARATATVGWLSGQVVQLSTSPPMRLCRPVGQHVLLRLSAPGHLSFLFPFGVSWSAREVEVELEAPPAAACT